MAIPKGYSYRPLPDSLTIKKSPIEGLGVFAVKKIEQDALIGIVHHIDCCSEDGLIRTPLGGFINHSDTPNCVSRRADGQKIIHLFAVRQINKGDELTLDYNQCLNCE